MMEGKQAYLGGEENSITVEEKREMAGEVKSSGKPPSSGNK